MFNQQQSPPHPQNRQPPPPHPREARQFLADYAGVDPPIDVPAESRELGFPPPPTSGTTAPLPGAEVGGKEKKAEGKKRFWGKGKEPISSEGKSQSKDSIPKAQKQFQLDLKKISQKEVFCVALAATFVIYLLPLHANLRLPINPLGITVFAISTWTGCRYFKKYTFGDLTLVALAGYILAFLVLKR